MYKEIRKGQAWHGDIIKVSASIYDDSIITNNWNLHFVKRTQFLRIDSISNNGTIKAHDKTGKRILTSIDAPGILAVYSPQK